MSDRFSEFEALNQIGDQLERIESTGGSGPRARWPRWLAGLLALGAVGVALSPAGADVREVIGLKDDDQDCLAPVEPAFGAVARMDGASRREALKAAIAGAQADPADCEEVLTLEELQQLTTAYERRIEQGLRPGNDSKISALEAMPQRIQEDALERAAELRGFESLYLDELRGNDP
jgi:hypothetical protein